MICFVAHYMSR